MTCIINFNTICYFRIFNNVENIWFSSVCKIKLCQWNFDIFNLSKGQLIKFLVFNFKPLLLLKTKNDKINKNQNFKDK